MYRLIANAILRMGMDLVLVGYNVYAGDPTVTGHVDHQVKRDEHIIKCWPLHESSM